MQLMYSRDHSRLPYQDSDFDREEHEFRKGRAAAAEREGKRLAGGEE
jgi:hypothetical protein